MHTIAHSLAHRLGSRIGIRVTVAKWVAVRARVMRIRSVRGTGSVSIPVTLTSAVPVTVAVAVTFSSRIALQIKHMVGLHVLGKLQGSERLLCLECPLGHSRFRPAAPCLCRAGDLIAGCDCAVRLPRPVWEGRHR